MSSAAAIGRDVFVIGLLMLGAARPAQADSDTVAVQARSYTRQFIAYAQVEPITVVRVRAAMAGVLTGLMVAPGARVGAGALLARVGGPAVEAAGAAQQAAVIAAKAAAVAAQKSFAIQAQKLRLHLGTQEAVGQAQAAVAQSAARLGTAKAQVQAFYNEAVFEAPEAGQVLTVEAANGERVQPGQVILTIAPADDLWLKASFYGADGTVIHPGMHGRFQAAAGGAVVPVAVRSVIGPLRPDGGLVIGAATTATPSGWRNGEAGTLILDGPTGTLPAVPTRALILDQGRWWVLVRSSHGDRRQEVQLGPSEGDLTLIRRGLSAGTQVVVGNAYLAFHRDFSQSYQPPD